eukprot:1370251-Amorphochlora_amoeboformis.AAC.1
MIVPLDYRIHSRSKYSAVQAQGLVSVAQGKGFQMSARRKRERCVQEVMSKDITTMDMNGNQHSESMDVSNNV